MTVGPRAGDDENDRNAPDLRVDWEVPEIAAIAILVAVGIVIVGGLATGIVAAVGTGTLGTGLGEVLAGDSMQVGAAWAQPLLAFVLLGVLGLCWWQVDAWSDASDPAPEAAGHIRRGLRIAAWVVRALVLTLVGSAALLAGVVLVDSRAGGDSFVWSRAVYESASVLAVAAIVWAGIWMSARLRATPDDDPAELRGDARRLT